MRRRIGLMLLSGMLLVWIGNSLDAAEISLFDGETLQGWNGNTASVWRVEEGAIVGGSLEGNPRNEFLATERTYNNFHLRLEYRLIGDEGFVNGGVQFHSQRITDPPNEMIGYQADIGAGYSGFLYDESRRKRFLAEADPAFVKSLERTGQWNQLEVIATGNLVTILLNGQQTISYREREEGIAQEGHIALQIHGNCKAEISFRNLRIQELSDSAVRPNFVIIMVDDMGHAGVSCFGNPYFKTPEIDRLATEGMRLTDFHSSGAVCSPTRAGLLTGRYQQRAGIEAVIHPQSDHPEHRKGLQKSEVTFAEMLQAAGYATALIGKWHQGYVHNSEDYHPQNHGFTEFIGYHSGNIDFVSHVGDHNAHDWWHGRQETKEEGYVTDLLNRHALEFIERNQEGPFCLYLPHLAIHNPVQVRGDPVRRTEKDGWKRWKPANFEERINKYRGMTLPIDEGVGQIRHKLDSLGIERETLVLFFSDNGAAAQDFPSGSTGLRGNKGSVYEGGHRVPFIAWWPGTIEADSEQDSPATTLDIMPTLLSLAGLEPPSNRPLDGIDLSPLLLARQPLGKRPLYWAALSNSGQRAEAMRDDPWKLVVQHPRAATGSFENEQVELYRLDQDPSEQHDLAKEHPERARQMLKRLKAWYADTQRTATAQPGGWPEQAAATILDAQQIAGPIGEEPNTTEASTGGTKSSAQSGRHLLVELHDAVGNPIANTRIRIFDGSSYFAGRKQRYKMQIVRTDRAGIATFENLFALIPEKAGYWIQVVREKNETWRAPDRLSGSGMKLSKSDLADPLVHSEVNRKGLKVTITLRQECPTDIAIVDATTGKRRHFAQLLFKDDRVDSWTLAALQDYVGDPAGDDPSRLGLDFFTTIVPEMSNAQFMATREGYYPLEFRLKGKLSVDNELRQRVQLQPAPLIELTVLNAVGNPVRGAKLKYLGPDLRGSYGPARATDDNGRTLFLYPELGRMARYEIQHPSGTRIFSMSELPRQPEIHWRSGHEPDLGLSDPNFQREGKRWAIIRHTVKLQSPSDR